VVKIRHFLESTELIILASIIIPLLIPLNLSNLKFMIEVSLGLMMLIAIRPFMRHKFSIKKNIASMLTSISMSYIVLSGMFLFWAYLLIGVKSIFFIGYVLIAIVPPAISIIPFCFVSKCNDDSADASMFVAFGLSLIIIPVILYLLYGKSIDFFLLLRIITVLIIIPIILAYWLRHSKSTVFHYGKIITNLCLAIVVLISISLNRKVFFDFSNPEIVHIYAINALAVFGTGLFVYFVAKHVFFTKEATNYSLYASQKNVGTSITLGILLFTPVAAVPAITALVFQLLYFILFEEIAIKRKII
jgi:BASS family bile acid:Na+ symporter